MWPQWEAGAKAPTAEAEAEAAEASAPVVQTALSQLQDNLEQLRSLGKAMGRQVSNVSDDAVSGSVVGSLSSGPPPPAAPEMHGTFALAKPGMLGKTNLEARVFTLVRGMGKETMPPYFPPLRWYQGSFT